MNRQARVRKLYEDGTALVIYADQCTMDCHQCSGCRREEGVIAQNPEAALPGELVQVRHHPEKVLLAALVLYILPIASFFVGFWAGAAWWNAGGPVGCIALALGIGGAVVYDRCAASRPGSGYTIIKYPQNIIKGDNEID